MGIEREEEILNKNDKKIIEDEALEAKISKTVAAYLKDNIKENKESYSNRPFIEIAEEYFRNPNINKNDKRDTLDKIKSFIHYKIKKAGLTCFLYLFIFINFIIFILNSLSILQ